jgi:hypothetical protein
MLYHILILLSIFTTTNAITCSSLRSIFNEGGCCSPSADVPCLQVIPECADVTNGLVCFDDTNVVVKGLLDAFAFTDTQITLKKHLIPETNNAYDFGNAEYKIRDIYEAD